MSDETEMTEAGTSSNEQGGDPSDPKYKGVRKRKWGKWVSEIRLPNSRERIWLGSYDSAEKAARAFDAAQFCLRGRNAQFNFPDPPDIPGGRDLTPAEIQVAAARFANSAPDPPASPGQEGRDAYPVPRTESSSASEGTMAGMDHDFGMYTTEAPFFDPSQNGGGSGYYGFDYGIFPGFDDLNYFGTNTASGSNYGEENYDGVLVQDYDLWSF